MLFFTASLRPRPMRRFRYTARTHFAPLLAQRPVGMTLQIDEGPEVFDAKFGNVHALFVKTP
jgi:5-carboxymethyl-2-hydroxymuconate isomerase